MKNYLLAMAALLLIATSTFSQGRATGDETIGTVPIVVHGHHNFATNPAGEVQIDTWTWGGGITHTVRTERHDNESPETWCKRHKQDVMAALQTFPPDHPQQHFLNQIGRYGEFIIADWGWIPEGTSIPIHHILSVEHQLNEVNWRWRSRFVDDLRFAYMEFPKG